MKILAAFDFDHTIIDDNSDTAIVSLLKDGIPPKLKELHHKDGWTAFMQGIFDLLHKNGISGETIFKLIRKLKPVEGMLQLLIELSKTLHHDVIIISDSNSCFIDTWLEEHDVQNCILRVFTNPAKFVNDSLKIEMYHLQEYCDLSTKNLCKGQILDDFIECQKKNNITYDKVLYVGDGTNDLCPMLRLHEEDFAFVRKKYKLEPMIKEANKGKLLDNQGNPRVLQANVVFWKNGNEILDIVKKF